MLLSIYKKLVVDFSKITLFFLLITIGFSLYHAKNFNLDAKPVVIYGAGASGNELFQSLMLDPSRRLIAFFDNSKNLKDTQINNIPILSTMKQLAHLKDKFQNLEVLLAIPSINTQKRREIIHSLEKIRVEYQILKRKLWEGTDFPIPRISKFVPANGKPSMNMAWKNFMGFVDSVFGDEGEVIQTDFPTNKGKPCDWCEFKERGLCPAWN